MLKQITKTKQSNGAYIEALTDIGTYYVLAQTLSKNIVASIYGATIGNVIRLRSVRSELEEYLDAKVNTGIGNVSEYVIHYGSNNYKIIGFSNDGIDITL